MPKKPTVYSPPPEDLPALERARAFLRQHLKTPQGAHCVLCTQLAKVYYRSLGASMAYVLCLLDRETAPGEWVHVQNLLGKKQLPSAVAASGDYAKLRYWGFIEAQDREREDGSSRNGFWRITDKGRSFARGETRTPSRAVVYADKFLRLDDKKTVSIREAFGKRFNYDDLMSEGT